jgi:hypothetical protein
VLLILENQRLQFIWDLLRTIAVVVLWVAAGWLRLQPVHALVAYSALGSIFYLLYIYLGHEEIRRRYAQGSSR